MLRGMIFFFVGSKNVIKLIVMKVEQLCECTNKHWIVWFKLVNDTLCELYFNKAATIPIRGRRYCPGSILDVGVCSSGD